ncbi:beta-lactamase family protein [Solitalea sp. MAHUQ-68]|uniref:Beta-lactamase family protein n=1 Tax=Solitalea agri TaxID=2953739 RepID=A0A9X2JCX4_9SPHI|nr:serine hydrolase domain-containing protein [Solitalea agri]MCO4292255.1 beta-lactamase family protein [Solitalea agri]
MKCLLTILFFAISTHCYGQTTVHFADSIRNYYHIPELSYAVIDSKSTFEIAALGKHSISLPDTATLNDRFHLGSNTKAMTAFIIAKYVESGKMSWTTRFFDLFPDWKGKSDSGYATITLQDLLSHKARIAPLQGEEGDPEIPAFKGTPQERRKLFGQFVLTLAPVQLDDQHPFIYSNAGYTLAALMLEKISGKSWEELVDQVFNKDLKLAVQFSWPENQQHKDTWGHRFENGTLIPVPSTIDFHLDYTEPAGDLNIQLKNYIKFIQLNLQGLNGQNNYLKAETYQFILKGIKNYALGWYNIYEGNKEFSTHGGTVGTYYTLVQIDRIKEKAYIIFTNSFNQDTQQGVKVLMRKLKENYGSY